jgi:hypothetical protein
VIESALRDDVIDHPCIQEILVTLFFEDNDSWGRTFGHLFENKFPLQVLALVVAMVSLYIYIHIAFRLN